MAGVHKSTAMAAYVGDGRGEQACYDVRVRRRWPRGTGDAYCDCSNVLWLLDIGQANRPMTDQFKREGNPTV